MRPLVPPLASFACGALLALLGGLGCSSVSSSAVRTDGGIPLRHLGAVRLYAVTPPAGVRVIGVVDVHAVNEEANFPTLMPVFMRRVADLGATGGIIDRVETRYEVRTEMRVESYAFPCGYRQTCWGSRLVPYTYQVRFLSIQGRAIVPEGVAPAMVSPPAPPPPAGAR